MAKQQRIYKIDKTELEDMVAMATVTDEKETVTLITNFCEFMAIPLDKGVIKSKTDLYQEIAKKLASKSKTK